MIGAGARKLIERGLEVEGRAMSVSDIDRLTRDFIDYYADHIADASRPFEGLEAALDDLEALGCRFAVCTNKLEWLSKRLLDELGLSPRFAAICGADTFGVAKPDPVILQQTVARAGGHIGATIMIGGEKECSLVPPANSFFSAGGLPWSYLAIIQLLAAWPACSRTL